MQSVQYFLSINSHHSYLGWQSARLKPATSKIASSLNQFFQAKMFINDIYLTIFIPSGCQSHQISWGRCSRQMMIWGKGSHLIDLQPQGWTLKKKIQHSVASTAGEMRHAASLQTTYGWLVPLKLQVNVPRCFPASFIYGHDFALPATGEVVETAQITITHQSSAAAKSSVSLQWPAHGQWTL